MIHDVVIIGGGLAGLALSLDLKKRGYTIVLIEKGSYPRQKVCGEYISMESHRYLLSLCPALSGLNLPLIKNFRITSTGLRDFKTPLGSGGFGISRYLLEELLYEEAKKAGVIFLLDTKAQSIAASEAGICSVVTKSETIRSKIICNASGRRSNLEMTERGQKQTGTNYVGIKYHIKLKRDAGLIEIHNFPGGYCGISAIEEDKSCLCYIVNAKELNAVNKSIPELEKKILSQNVNLKKIFTDADFLFREPVTVSGINFLIKEPLTTEQFFLGDSAGSIAPVTGNGMSMGLRSAFVLANLLDDYFSGNITKDKLDKSYSDFWKKEFAMRIKLSRHFQKLSEYSSLTNITIRLFQVIPSLARRIIRLTHGKPF
ncbi:hypothetical protein CNR22_23410 [Sphingobacteriaceae bacterium]|nr:hypothetical protein CNR22_23410 [Sphingobacteriaceae bacterium]